MFQFLNVHLTGLATFSGRESRQRFWIWAALVFGLSVITMMAVMIPSFLDIFSQVDRIAAEHPEQVTRTYGPGGYSVQIEGHHPELLPDFVGMIYRIGLSALVSVLLLGAAVVRRLHDCGRTGLWGLLPLPFLTAGFVLMPHLFGQLNSAGEPDMGLFFGLFFNNLIYLGALGVLIVLLAQAGTPGENHFGPPPAD